MSPREGLINECVVNSTKESVKKKCVSVLCGYFTSKRGSSRCQICESRGFLSEFTVLVGGLLLYWACWGVESATITTMEGWDLPASGRKHMQGGENI